MYVYIKVYFIWKIEKHMFSITIKLWKLQTHAISKYLNNYNGKDYFLQAKGIPMGCSFFSSFANIFLFNYETNFYHNINFFRYIDDIIVFNCDNFENISLSIYPKE